MVLDMLRFKNTHREQNTKTNHMIITEQNIVPETQLQGLGARKWTELKGCNQSKDVIK